MNNSDTNQAEQLNETAVNSSTFKGYWVICQYSYEVDGIEIPKGRMDFHESIRPIQNKCWRRATQEEIDTRQRFKGNTFNLRFV